MRGEKCDSSRVLTGTSDNQNRNLMNYIFEAESHYSRLQYKYATTTRENQQHDFKIVKNFKLLFSCIFL